jgi:ubiquinone/menaquinone biosynthesis C-methylase UbiE
MGYRSIGIEPSDEARQVAVELIASTGVEATVVPGTAEATGLPDNSADVVCAKSVVEHVDDAQAAFNEIYRILRPGGIFWFATASSRCPRQMEISGFPMFGWYPDRLKRRIMAWAKVNRPELVGRTEHPAIHWFTPAKARRMLRAAGFTGPIWDRWDLRRPEEGGARYRFLLRLAKHSSATKLLADMLVPGCGFAVVK